MQLCCTFMYYEKYGMYYIPSCTIYHHVLYTIMYYIPSCTIYHHVLYTIMYYIPSCTIYHHVLYTIMYYIPSCTIYHHVLYTIMYYTCNMLLCSADVMSYHTLCMVINSSLLLLKFYNYYFCRKSLICVHLILNLSRTGKRFMTMLHTYMECFCFECTCTCTCT